MIGEVWSLADRMEKELRANESKGDWRETAVRVSGLFVDIAYHQAKLMMALKDVDKEKIAEHTADVCNLYLMLAYAYGCFRDGPPHRIRPSYFDSCY